MFTMEETELKGAWLHRTFFSVLLWSIVCIRTCTAVWRSWIFILITICIWRPNMCAMVSIAVSRWPKSKTSNLNNVLFFRKKNSNCFAECYILSIPKIYIFCCCYLLTHTNKVLVPCKEQIGDFVLLPSIIILYCYNDGFYFSLPA